MLDFFRRKKKKKTEQEKISKENLKTFLKEISSSVDLNFSGQESNQLEKILKAELQNWFAKTIGKDRPLDSTSLKIGVCLGIIETLRKINEAEEIEKVTYIA